MVVVAFAVVVGGASGVFTLKHRRDSPSRTFRYTCGLLMTIRKKNQERGHGLQDKPDDGFQTIAPRR